jgi:PAS domain S-box-containing protein
MGLLDRFTSKDDGSALAAEVKRTSERHLRNFIDGLHEGFIQINSNHIVLIWNRQAEEIFGWTKAEAEGKLLYELIIPEAYREAHVTGLNTYLETKRGRLVDRTIEVPALRKDGSTLPISLFVHPVENEDGDVVKFNAFIQDKTQIKRAELDRERFEAIINTMQDALYSVGRDKLILTWNPGAEKVFGWTAREVIGHNVNVIVPPGYQDDVDYFLQATIDGDVHGPFTTKRITKGGKIIDVNIIVSPLKDVTSYIVGASLLARDVTEESRSEHIRAIFASLLDSAPAAVFVFDKDGRVIAVNKFALKLYNVAATTDVEGHHFDEFVVEEERVVIQKVFDKVMADKTSVNNLYIHRTRPDGSTFEALATYSPVLNDKGESIGVYTTSTTVEQFKESIEKLGLNYKEVFGAIMKSQPTLLD